MFLIFKKTEYVYFYSYSSASAQVGYKICFNTDNKM